jgi:hypothetical protein
MVRGVFVWYAHTKSTHEREYDATIGIVPNILKSAISFALIDISSHLDQLPHTKANPIAD